MQSGLEAPSIDVTATQRQVGALETSTLEQFQTIRSVAGSADASFSFGARASRPTSGAQGDRYFADDIGARGGYLYLWNGVAWEIIVGWASGTNAQRSGYTPDTTDSGGFFLTTDTGKIWEIVGSTWTDRFVTLDLTTSLKIGGTQVVGTQGAAVADAAGGAVIDVEARAAINALLARARAHGWIAT